LTTTEVRKFLESTKRDRFGPLYALAANTGLREGEILGLQWQHVNAKKRYLMVMHTLGKREIGADKHVTMPNGKLKRYELALRHTKTEKSSRRVDLSKNAIRALDNQKLWLESNNLQNCAYVFPSLTGAPLHKDSLLRAFKKALKSAGLQEKPFHSLRHSCASMLLEQNVHPKVIQEMLGHSTITQTLQTYSHLIPTLHREAANTMDRILR
jgi:integrase